jgi:hypothetical protein
VLWTLVRVRKDETIPPAQASETCSAFLTQQG